jgi:hypothetical protein
LGEGLFGDGRKGDGVLQIGLLLDTDIRENVRKVEAEEE